jgi:hypothetical protein
MTESQAELYRRRATEIGRLMKSSKDACGPSLKEQKALNDMADNEDWLDGKRGSQLKSFSNLPSKPSLRTASTALK